MENNIFLDIHPQVAVLFGLSHTGVVEVHPDWSALSVQQRKALVRAAGGATYEGRLKLHAGESDLSDGLDNALARIADRQLAAEAEREEAQRARIEQDVATLSGYSPEQLADNWNSYADGPTRLLHCLAGDEVKRVLDHPEVRGLVRDARAIVRSREQEKQELEKAAVEQYVQELTIDDLINADSLSVKTPKHKDAPRVIAIWESAQARAEVLRQERQNRRASQLEAWVQEYGTLGQRKRHTRGLLAEHEILDGMREQAFGPLNALERYERITCQEVRESYGESFPAQWWEEVECQFSVAPAETATDAQMERLEAVEKEMPRAQVELRRHLGYVVTSSVEEDKVAQVVRDALHVTVVMGELVFTREYAA